MPYKHSQILWNKEDIISITDGEWILNEPKSVSIKGKSLVPELCKKDFIYMAYGKNSPLKRMDLVVEALKKGASLIISDTKTVKFPPYASVLYVKNPVELNNKFASVAREKTDAKVIAITGSVGKTSTKDMVSEMLSYCGLTYSNFRSINGGSGLENELANVSKETQFCIFELGMKAPDTIRPMSKLVKPHIALITAIAPAHISFHDGMDSIVETKVQIADGLEPGGVLILPRDSEYFEDMKTRVQRTNKDINICTFGKHQDSDIRLLSYSTSDTSSGVTVSIYGKVVEYQAPFIEEFKIFNTLAAVATAYCAKVDIEKAVKGIGFVKPSFRRGERFRADLKNQLGVIEIIDDTWNANPVSMGEAIKQMRYRSVPKTGRRGLILGDMVDLGDNSVYYHKQLLDLIVEAKIDFVCTVGQYMNELHDILPSDINKYHRENIDLLVEELDSIVRKNDVILVKGSNSTHVYKAVLHFIGSYDSPRALNNWSLVKEVSLQENILRENISNQFDKELVSFMEEYNIQGISLSVSLKGKNYSKGYGIIGENEEMRIDPQRSKFRLFSLTKPITAVAILLLVQEGKLKLTDKVFGENGILSSFAPDDGMMNKELEQIEIQHLLEHTAGWSLEECINPFTKKQRFDPMFNLGNIGKALHKETYANRFDVIQYMFTQPLQFKPGSKYSYSNLGYNILGRVIEVVSKQLFYKYIHENILEPLNLTSVELAHTKIEERAQDEVYYYSQNMTQYKTALFDKESKVTDPYGIFMVEELDANGGLIASSDDMLKFILNFDSLLSDDILKAMIQKPNITNNTNWHYGLGWRVTPKKDGTMNLWHRGTINVGGATGFMVRSLEKDSFSWVLLLNKSVNLAKLEKMMLKALPKLEKVLSK